MNTVTLKPSKEKSLLRRHPWVYANAIDRVEGKPAAGATVLVRAHDGRFLGRAAWSPHSQIRARVWSFDEAEPIDHAFFKRRVQRALAHRQTMVHDTGAVRLIFGSDYRLLIPASALCGAIAIVLADTLARTIVPPTELPVGAMTAMAGAPVFIYLLRRGLR